MSEQSTTFFGEILNEQAEREELLTFRYPWVPLFYNWVIAGFVILLFVGFFLWGLAIKTDRMAEAKAAEAMAVFQAEQDAKEAERLQELEAAQAATEYVDRQMATAIAKADYGIRRFVEKYHYGADDMATYHRSIFNRADASGRSVEEVVSQEGQYLGYSDDNPVLDEYFDKAIEDVMAWREEETKPCDLSYQFAELTPDGVFLVNDINAGAYGRRWHA